MNSQHPNSNSPPLPSPFPPIILLFLLLTPSPQSCGTKSRDFFFPLWIPQVHSLYPWDRVSYSRTTHWPPTSLTIHPSSGCCDMQPEDAPWYSTHEAFLLLSLSCCDSCSLHSQISALAHRASKPRLGLLLLVSSFWGLVIQLPDTSQLSLYCLRTFVPVTSCLQSLLIPFPCLWLHLLPSGGTSQHPNSRTGSSMSRHACP